MRNIKRVSALVLCVLMSFQIFGYCRERVLRDDPEAEGLSTFTMQDPGTGDWITVGDR